MIKVSETRSALRRLVLTKVAYYQPSRVDQIRDAVWETTLPAAGVGALIGGGSAALSDNPAVRKNWRAYIRRALLGATVGAVTPLTAGGIAALTSAD